MWRYKYSIFSILVVLFLIHLTLGQDYDAEDEDIGPNGDLKVPEIVSRYGYPIEEYVVETDDNYLLKLHRIPYGKNDEPSAIRPVFFLMHGLLCSSSFWVMLGPKLGLAFLLADKGYDVWLGNARGNVYSRNHTDLDPEKADFWSFSWNEIGQHDLPTMIDFVLNKTQKEKLYYAGHSQGTTSFFVMTSTKPQYNDKIQLMFALAPIAYMGNIPNKVLRTVTPYIDNLDMVAKFVGVNEYLPPTQLLKMVQPDACRDNSPTQQICINILFSLAGTNDEQLNTSFLPVIVSHIPAGAATKQLLHYGQEIKSGHFRQYDFGSSKNMDKYNDSEPPNYDTAKITAPVVLLAGKNDLMASLIDVKRLSEELPNVVDYYEISDELFSHLDFLWAKDLPDLLYNKMFDLLDNYTLYNN